MPSAPEEHLRKHSGRGYSRFRFEHRLLPLPLPLKLQNHGHVKQLIDWPWDLRGPIIAIFALHLGQSLRFSPREPLLGPALQPIASGPEPRSPGNLSSLVRSPDFHAHGCAVHAATAVQGALLPSPDFHAHGVTDFRVRLSRCPCLRGNIRG